MQSTDTYDPYELEGPAPNPGWIRRHAGHIALAVGAASVLIFSGIVVLYSESSALATIYPIACLTCIGLLYCCRRDVFSPVGSGTLWYSLSFLLPIPFHVSPSAMDESALSHSGLALSVGLSLVGLLCYALGSVCGADAIFRPIFRWVTSTKAPLRPSSHRQFILMVAWVIMAGAIRYGLRLESTGGEGADAPARVAGVLAYTLKGGTLLLIGLFFYRARRGAIMMIEGFILVSGYAVVQMLMGWKSALLEPLVMFIVVLWYQQTLSHRRRSLLWILIPLMLVPTSMSVGHAYRARIIEGTKSEYAASAREFALKIVSRVDGNYRFVAVLGHEMEGRGLSFTNDFKMFSLMSTGITTVSYADWYVFKHPVVGAATSSGASGPGGAYIGMGLLGIVLGYLLIGAIVKALFSVMTSLPDPSLAVALYGITVINLDALFAENFLLSLLAKHYFLYAIVLIVAKTLLVSRSQEEQFSAPDALVPEATG